MLDRDVAFHLPRPGGSGARHAARRRRSHLAGGARRGPRRGPRRVRAPRRGGHRTSYWGNLDLEGAVVADLTGFDRVLAIRPDDGVATVQSGISLRALDLALRAHGAHLPIHPDVYGDTTIGGGLSNAVSAGIGMFSGDFASQITGFEVLLGSGEFMQVGASRMLGARPGAIARGMPDLRSLFVGAEGALGVITEVDVLLAPAEWETRLTLRTETDRFEDALAFALAWRGRAGPETIRWTFRGTGELHVRVGSALGEAHLAQRLEHVRATLQTWPAPEVEHATDDERSGTLPGYARKWPGPTGATWDRARSHPFAGIDGVVPYGRAKEAWAWAKSLVLTVPNAARLAAYFGREGVNLGVHCTFPDTATRDQGRAELDARLGAFAALGAVPYRTGRVWREHVRAHLDPSTAAVLRAVAAQLDPSERFAPGVGILSDRPQ